MALSGGLTSGQKVAQQQGNQAFDVLEQARREFLSNLEYMSSLEATRRILDQPELYTPERIQQLKDENAQTAGTAYDAAMGRVNERAAAVGDFRGGATRTGERLAAVDLGNTISSGNRDIDLQATEKNRAAQLGAIDLGGRMAMVPYSLAQNLANARLGLAGSSIWQDSNNNGAMIGGIGSLLGTALTPASGAGSRLGSRIS